MITMQRIEEEQSKMKNGIVEMINHSESIQNQIDKLLISSCIDDSSQTIKIYCDRIQDILVIYNDKYYTQKMILSALQESDYSKHWDIKSCDDPYQDKFAFTAKDRSLSN